MKLKMPKYALARVQHAWIIDPEARVLEVFRLQSEGWQLASAFGEKDMVRAEPFHAFEFDLGALWPPRA